MPVFHRPFFDFFRSQNIGVIVAVLLVMNAGFLYMIWKKKESQSLPSTHQHSANTNYTSLTREIQHLIRSAGSGGLSKDTLSVEIYLTDKQCLTCIDEALPYWLALGEDGKLTIHFFSRSTSSRQTERISQQYGIPMKWINTVSSPDPSDSLLWNSTAPSVVIKNNVDRRIILVHIGDRTERERATVFYETFIHLIH